MDFDLLVIGAGSGGLASAKRAARHGAKVAIIEGDRVGGTCVIRGCVPKKLLVYGSEYREILANAASYGWSIGSSNCNSSVLLENVRQEVDRLNGIHIKALANAGVELISGWGQFVDAHTVRVGDRQFGDSSLGIHPCCHSSRRRNPPSANVVDEPRDGETALWSGRCMARHEGQLVVGEQT